ncbi:MAG: hypothetical protein M1357_02000 [Candidatus Marsarchaeota archaeon]|nr:hypothetical protein [Candidatus Marsarchaeota archaeon]
MFYYILVIALASELVANAVESLQKMFTSTFVGSVILGLLNNIPDTFIIVAAVLNRSSSIALATVLGANILAFTLGYSLVIVSTLYYHKETVLLSKDMHKELLFLVGSAVLVLFSAASGRFFWWSGVIMLILFSVYVSMGMRSQSHRLRNLRRKLSGLPDSSARSVERIIKPERREMGFAVAKIAAAAFILTYSARPFVVNIVGISQSLHLPLLLIAVIAAPVAAETPELVSSFVLSRRSVEGSNVAVANLVGSKVQSNTLVLGTAILLSSLAGTPITVGGELLPIAVLVAVNVYSLKATYDLELTRSDAAISFILYPVMLLAILLLH